MYRLYLLLITAALVQSCTKSNLNVEKVIFNLTIPKDPLLADGQTVIAVSAELDPKADVANRNIVFSSSGGTFGSTTDKKITVKAEYENKQLIARTTLKLPFLPQKLIISAQPEIRVDYADYIVKDSFTVGKSEPASIELEGSSLSVFTGFLSEVQLTATLKNQYNKNVSIGTRVEFNDYYFSNNLGVQGAYRALQLSSNETSKVSCIYSPGYVVPGTKIYIRVSVVNSNIADTAYLTVNQ